MANVINIDSEFRNLPKKQSSGNSVLDVAEKYTNVDLLKHLEDDHILKKLSIGIASANFTAYPSSTAFLILVSVFSGYAGRIYKVARYKNDVVGLPLGIYAVCEQPSGSAKDFAINMISNVFGMAHRDFVKSLRDQEKSLSIQLAKMKEGATPADLKNNDDFKKLREECVETSTLLEKAMNYSLDISDTTAEGLESSLIDTCGHAILASSEQELFDVLLCGIYSKGGNGKSGSGTNKGLILKGFDGGSVSVKRQGREGYKGISALSFTLFAQPGSMQKLFEASGYTGVAERFLKLFEPNSGGKRDFVNGEHFNFNLIDELKSVIEPLVSLIISSENITDPKSFYDLSTLNLSGESINALNHFRNEMERTVDDGGIYHESKISMLGTVTKCDQQVQKLSACLHLLGGGWYDDMINHKYVLSAINIIRDIMMSYSDLMENKGFTGDKSYYERIIGYISSQSKHRTEREIIQNLKGRDPFTMESPSKKIRQTIEKMIEQGLLKEAQDKATKQVFIVVA